MFLCGKGVYHCAKMVPKGCKQYKANFFGFQQFAIIQANPF